MEKEEVMCVVGGKVHGVGFRDFVAKYARHLALVGYVRNSPDFTIEIVAQGFRNNLERLIEHLHKGPFLSRVSRVDVEWRGPTKEFHTFEIVY
ncbi:MAG: acylphosphatase [bacterium]|nr:acylphosphatase [bacterium]